MPRTLRSDFVQRLNERRDVRENADALRAEVVDAAQEQRLYDLLPFAGQTVGLIGAVLPAHQIVAEIAAQARDGLESLRARAAGTAGRDIQRPPPPADPPPRRGGNPGRP